MKKWIRQKMKPNGVIEHRRRRKTQFMDWTGSNVDTYRQERTCAHSHTHTHVTKPKQSTLIDRLLRLWLPIRLPSSVTHKHTHPLPQLSIYLISLHCAATKQKEEIDRKLAGYHFISHFIQSVFYFCCVFSKALKQSRFRFDFHWDLRF